MESLNQHSVILATGDNFLSRWHFSSGAILTKLVTWNLITSWSASRATLFLGTREESRSATASVENFLQTFWSWAWSVWLIRWLIQLVVVISIQERTISTYATWSAEISHDFFASLRSEFRFLHLINFNISLIILLCNPFIFLLQELLLSFCESCWALTWQFSSSVSSTCITISPDLWLEWALLHLLLQSLLFGHYHLLMPLVVPILLLIM